MRHSSLLQRRRSFEGVLVVVTVVGTLTSIVVARSVGPTGRGQVTFATVWVQFLGFAGVFMLDTAVIVLSKRPALGIDPAAGLYEAGRLSLRFSVIASASAFTLGLIVTHNAVLSTGMAAAVFATVGLELMNGYLLASERGAAYLANRLAQPMLFAVGVAVVAIVFRGLGLEQQVALMVLALVLSLAVPAGTSFLRYRPHRPRRSKALARSLLRYAAGAQVASALLYLNARLDLLALPFRFSSRDVGIYAVAAAPAGFLAFMGTPGLLRAVTGQRLTRDRRAIIAVVTGTAMWLLACGWLIPGVFGARFEASVPVARVLAAGVVPAFLLQQANGRLLKAERTMRLAVVQGLGTAAFLLGFLLARTMIQVAWASVASYLVSFFVAEVQIKRLQRAQT